jgi:hypothetical protein
VAIFFDCSRQHTTSLKAGASLAHKNKVEILASNPHGAVLIGGDGVDLIALVLKNCGIVQEVLQVFIHHQQAGPEQARRLSCFSTMNVVPLHRPLQTFLILIPIARLKTAERGEKCGSAARPNKA